MFFNFSLALASTLLFTLFFGSSYGFSAVVAPKDLILHAYEHCHFTTRTRLVLGWAGVPFNLKWYGYGDGADPGKCEGFGYNPVDGGTIPLMGKKMCPVLTGTQVPTLEGKLGLGESMEICSYGISIGNKVVAPATGRSDVSKWLDDCGSTRKALERVRLIRMPISDFADQRDIDYTKWTHTRMGFDYDQAERDTDKLLADMKVYFDQLSGLLRGEDQESGMPTLNAWGVSIDDAMVLPIIRSLTCVRGIKMPTKIKKYVEKGCAKAGVSLFTQYAN